MEPVSGIALSLALGAGAIAEKAFINNLVKDAYFSLKDLLLKHYPKISVASLERNPLSIPARNLVEQELKNLGVGNDKDVIDMSKKLIQFLHQYEPESGKAIGVDLEDVFSDSVSISGIEASGSGVKIKHGVFSKDINISNVKSGKVS